MLSRSVTADSLRPHGLEPAGSSVHGDSLGKNIEVGCHALLQGNLPNAGIQPRSPPLQEDYLPAELPGKPSRGDFFFFSQIAQDRSYLF